MSKTVCVAALAAMVGAVSAATATVLPFNSFGTGGLAAYGDRIVSPVQGSTTYLEGFGWTPNIELNFVTLSTAGPVSIWSSGYASLVNALGHGSYDVPFRLDFVADPGWYVTLHAFDIATWSTGTYQTELRIWDDNGSFAAPNLFSFSGVLSPSIVYQPLTSAVTGVGTLSLYVSNIGSTGLDNVSFSQSPIPEPAMASVLVPAALLLRRRGR